MHSIVVTFEVSNPFKFKEVREEHPLNMLDIFVTLGVKNLEKSSFFKEVQLLKIFAKEFTFLVDKPVKLTEYKEEQPENMLSMS